MSPVKASTEEKGRGKRLEAWLARIRPDLPKTRRGPAVFGVSRQTVANWVNGADISNDAITRILEVGGPLALVEILESPMVEEDSAGGCPREILPPPMQVDPIRTDAV